MASVINDPNGRKRLSFQDSAGARRTIRLDKLDKKSAESIARHVEQLVNAKLTSTPAPRETALWLQSIGEPLRDKLAKVTLVESAQVCGLQSFLSEYILSRRDIKPATREVWQQPCRNLCEFFNPQKDVRSITPGDAERFAQWLNTQGLATATVAKRLSFARTFFHTARKHKLITENPFAEVKIPVADVTARQFYIDRDATAKLLEVASPNWRTIIALCRIGGLRCPSEVLSLEWRCVNWQTNELTVISPKTERYHGKGTRTIPLFPELRQHLEAARASTPAEQTHVVSGDYLAKANGPTGWKNCNIRKPLESIVRQAGLVPWPKLFHNLRSSRETDLLDEGFPPQTVAKWMGHDVKISMKHYAQVTDEHFHRATGGAKSGALSGGEVAQNRAQQPPATDSSIGRPEQESLGLQGFPATGCETLPDSTELVSGEGGIRTHGRFDTSPVFKTGALNRSATSPDLGIIAGLREFAKGSFLGTFAGRSQFPWSRSPEWIR